MNSPSNRQHLWSLFPVEILCGGLLLACGAAGIAMAQDNPAPSPPEPREPGRVSSGEGTFIKRRPLTLIGQVETPPTDEQAPPAGRTPAAVTPATKPNALPEFLPRLSANEQRIQEILGEATEVAFTDSPLEEALNYLEDLHNIEIWIDKESLSTSGINTDQQVTLTMSGISLRSALRLLLEPLSLTSVIEDDVLKITTQAAANKFVITRTYPVGDLFSGREQAEELVESLVCGLGLTQKSKDGPRPLAVSVASGAIIARLSHSQHDQLLQLLRDLREAKSLVPDRSAELFATPRVRVRQGNTSSSPTPLDEFSPGSESDSIAPRVRVPETVEPSQPAETPPAAKPKTNR